MSTYRTEGVILKRSNFGEANLLLQIYTKDHGKIEASARSARKPNGKLKGLLEPFLHCDFMIVHGKRMDTVAGSFVLDSFLSLRSDMQSILAAMVITDIANRMTMTGYKDERIFHLILKSLKFIDERGTAERRCVWLAIMFFELNILSLSGFNPHLGRCVFCGEKLQRGGNHFSNSLGGVLDKECGKKCPDAVSLDDDMIKLLKFLQISGEEAVEYAAAIDRKLDEMRKLKVSGGVLVPSIMLMKNFIEFNLDQKINSLPVFCNFAREGF